MATSNTPIADHVVQCFGRFENVVAAAQNTRQGADESAETIAIIIADELIRFKLWCGNIGAHRRGRSSLEYRLRDSSRLRAHVIQLLEDLADSLSQIEKLLHDDPDEDDEASDELDDELLELIESEAPAESALSLRTTDVTDINLSLLRFSMSIAHPAPYDRFISQEHAESTTLNWFYVRNVEDKYQKLKGSPLAERLGKALSRRRQYFKYRDSHHAKLSRGIDNSLDEDGGDGKSTIASSVHVDKKDQSAPAFGALDADDQSDTARTETSIATTRVDPARRRVPNIPKKHLDGPFKCPFCCYIIPVTERTQWKRHVYADLRPYTCLFQPCATANVEYGRRHEWMDHVLQTHWKTWTCSSCGHTETTHEGLRQHLQSTHTDLAARPDLDLIVARSGRSKPRDQPIECQLCEATLTSMRQYERHVGKHLVDLALVALPPIDDENEDEGDGMHHSGDEDEQDTEREIEEVERFDSDDESEVGSGNGWQYKDNAAGLDEQASTANHNKSPHPPSLADSVPYTTEGLDHNENSIPEVIIDNRIYHTDSTASEDESVPKVDREVPAKAGKTYFALGNSSDDDAQTVDGPSARDLHVQYERMRLEQSIDKKQKRDLTPGEEQELRDTRRELEQLRAIQEGEAKEKELMRLAEERLKEEEREAAERTIRDEEARIAVERYKRKEAERLQAEAEKMKADENEYRARLTEQLHQHGVSEEDIRHILEGRPVPAAGTEPKSQDGPSTAAGNFQPRPSSSTLADESEIAGGKASTPPRGSPTAESGEVIEAQRQRIRDGLSEEGKRDYDEQLRLLREVEARQQAKVSVDSVSPGDTIAMEEGEDEAIRRQRLGPGDVPPGAESHAAPEHPAAHFYRKEITPETNAFVERLSARFRRADEDELYQAEAEARERMADSASTSNMAATSDFREIDTGELLERIPPQPPRLDAYLADNEDPPKERRRRKKYPRRKRLEDLNADGQNTDDQPSLEDITIERHQRQQSREQALKDEIMRQNERINTRPSVPAPPRDGYRRVPVTVVHSAESTSDSAQLQENREREAMMREETSVIEAEKERLRNRLEPRDRNRPSSLESREHRNSD